MQASMSERSCIARGHAALTTVAVAKPSRGNGALSKVRSPRTGRGAPALAVQGAMREQRRPSPMPQAPSRKTVVSKAVEELTVASTNGSSKASASALDFDELTELIK